MGSRKTGYILGYLEDGSNREMDFLVKEVEGKYEILLGEEGNEDVECVNLDRRRYLEEIGKGEKSEGAVVGVGYFEGEEVRYTLKQGGMGKNVLGRVHILNEEEVGKCYYIKVKVNGGDDTELKLLEINRMSYIGFKKVELQGSEVRELMESITGEIIKELGYMREMVGEIRD